MLKIYAVRDAKAEAYGSLICCATAGLATRAFADACADSRSPMASYPKDYDLYELGTFDPSSGQVVGYALPKFIASASEMLNELKRIRSVSEPELPIKEAVN